MFCIYLNRRVFVMQTRKPCPLEFEILSTGYIWYVFATDERATTFMTCSFVFLHANHLLKRDLLDKERLCFPSRDDPLSERRQNNTITKTRLYNIDPLKPHFYIVKLGFTGVYIIFLISS